MGLCEFFIYFGDQTLVQGIIDKYIFPYSWLPFQCADVFFSCAEAFELNEVPFVYSILYIPALGDILMKILRHRISEIFMPMFLSRTIMVSQLIFKSFIHLEFILVYGIGWGSSFIFLHVAVQVSPNYLLKSLFLLHFMLLPPLSNIN